MKKKLQRRVPNPGSEEALDRGCRCPVLDNNRGKGAYVNEQGQPEFWTSADCPLHGGER